MAAGEALNAVGLRLWLLGILVLLGALGLLAWFTHWLHARTRKHVNEVHADVRETRDEVKASRVRLERHGEESVSAVDRGIRHLVTLKTHVIQLINLLRHKPPPRP